MAVQFEQQQEEKKTNFIALPLHSQTNLNLFTEKLLTHTILMPHQIGLFLYTRCSRFSVRMVCIVIALLLSSSPKKIGLNYYNTFDTECGNFSWTSKNLI